MKHNTPKQDAAQAAKRQRMKTALQLRTTGYTYEQIATHMHISKSTAHAYVQDALKDITHETAEELLQIQEQRYNQLLQAALPLANLGELPYMTQALNILSRIENLRHLHDIKNTPINTHATPKET